jgi:hypothetical protein
MTIEERESERVREREREREGDTEDWVSFDRVLSGRIR